MEFQIKNINKSMNDLMRTIGYQAAHFQSDGEFSMIKKLGRDDYPRFHLYVKEQNSSIFFNLHLDQKKPSYEGSHGHSGEYDGKLLEEEAERIKKLIEI